MDKQDIARRIQNMIDAAGNKEGEQVLAESESLIAEIESEVAKMEKADPPAGKDPDAPLISPEDRLLRVIAGHLRAAEVEVRATHLNEAQERLILAQNLISHGEENQQV